MKRFGRKLDVNRMRTELPLQPFWFDSIYLDDASLADESQRRRFAALHEIVPPGSVVPHLVMADEDQAEDFPTHPSPMGTKASWRKRQMPAMPQARAGNRGSRSKNRGRSIW